MKVSESDVLDQKTLNSFLKEASQVVGWKHPSIVPVYEDMKLQLLDGTEQVVLSDFGLSVHVDATHHTFYQPGTLEYMAPEQFRGIVEPASDIFALGVILYHLCTGQVPFHRS